MIYQNATAEPREELQDFIQEGVTDFGEFVGLQLLPPMPLTLVTGHVPKITIAKGDLLRAANRNRAPGTNFNRWQMAIDAHSITLVQVAEEQSIPDEQTMLYEDYFDIEALGATEATSRLKRGHEIECEGAIFNTGNFDSNNTSVAWTAANCATTGAATPAVPINDILAAIRVVKARGERPNTVVIPGPVWDRISLCNQMIQFVAGTVNPAAVVTAVDLQKKLAVHGIEQVLVPDCYVNQSDSLSSAVINAVWPNTYVAVISAKPGALRGGGVGRTFYWDKQGPLFQLFSYRDEVKASNVIRSRKTTLTDITNTRAGTLIGTQYS